MTRWCGENNYGMFLNFQGHLYICREGEGHRSQTQTGHQ